MPDTPFHEEEPRLDTPNFYYAQEDELFAAAERQGFTWSVHRSHTVIGHAVGNAMNMGLTLAVQATLAKELDLDFVFPGSEAQWNGLTDMTDAGMLAEQMVWASTVTRRARTSRSTSSTATSSAGAGCGRASPRTSASTRRASSGSEDAPRPLEEQMAPHEAAWAAHRRAPRPRRARHHAARVVVAHRRRPRPRDGGRHRHGQEPRRRVHRRYRRTEQAFADLFERYRADRLIP